MADDRALAERMEKLEQIVRGVPPNYDGLQRQSVRQAAQIRRLLLVVDGDTTLDHKGMRGQLNDIKDMIAQQGKAHSGEIQALREQFDNEVRVRMERENQVKGAMMAFRAAGAMLGLDVLIRVAQIMGFIQP